MTPPRRPPLFSAVETAECGLACVAMVAAFHGHDVNLAGLRRRFGVAASGARLRDLMETLESLEMQARAVRLDVPALGQLAVPAILHWNLDHFVVLSRVSRGRYEILDPALGERTLTEAEMSAAFTGVALEISRAHGFTPKRQRVDLPFSTVWTAVEGWRAPAVQVLLLALILQIVGLGVPVATQVMVDDAILSGDVAFAGVIVGGLLAIVLFQVLFELLRGWITETLRQRVSYQLTGSLVRHLLRLPAGFFERRGVADIVSRVQSSNALRDIVTKSGLDAVIDMVMAATLLVALVLYSRPLTLVVVLGVALQAAMYLTTFPLLRRRLERQITSVAAEQGHLMESVRTAGMIKLLGTESRREGQWRSRYSEVVNANLAAARMRLVTGAANSAIAGLRFVAVMGLGASMVLSGADFTIGMLYAYLALQQMFSERSASLIASMVQLKSVGLHLERMSDIVSTPTDALSGGNPMSETLEGRLRLENVSFRYASNGAAVLKDLSLEVAPGEFIAIVGSSGSGKSTLLKILLGLETPTEGTVTVDGQPAVGERLRAWRSMVGCVLQDDKLVSGSIADNITFFDPDADMTRVESAAKAAQVHADIIRMPMQYASLVGEMGAALSGGQRQRIMLARALYRQPKVLILDEGTANLDAVVESEIAEVVAGLPITRISVSHRPALVRRADRVLVLEGGRLWPGGTAEGIV